VHITSFCFKLEIPSVERGICPTVALCMLPLSFNSRYLTFHNRSSTPFGSRDVISHVTVGLAIYGFLGGPLKPSLYLA